MFLSVGESKMDLENCPECGIHLSTDDVIQGCCPNCELVFEEDTGDLLADLQRDDTDKLGDAFDEDELDE